jgi:hypothetical protein
VFQGSQENLSHISATDSIMPGKRKRFLSYLNEVLPFRTIQEDTGPNDRVVQAARSDFILRALSPHKRVAFPQIQEVRGE